MCITPNIAPSLPQRCRTTSPLTVAPLLGSGTTMVAAQNLGRTCYALEIAPNYCAVILQRMTDAFPGIKIRREE